MDITYREAIEIIREHFLNFLHYPRIFASSLLVPKLQQKHCATMSFAFCTLVFWLNTKSSLKRSWNSESQWNQSSQSMTYFKIPQFEMPAQWKFCSFFSQLYTYMIRRDMSKISGTRILFQPKFRHGAIHNPTSPWFNQDCLKTII